MQEDKSKFTLSLFDDCGHEDIYQGFCTNCGLDVGMRLEMESVFSDNYMSSSKNEYKNYDNEINSVVGISEELKNKVIDNLSKEKRSMKETTRKLDVFQQLYVSGAELHQLNPEQNAKSLNLNTKNLNKSLRDISGTGTKLIRDEQGEITTCPIVSLDPINFLKEFCDKIAIIKPEFINMSKSFKELLKKSPCLLNERPKCITLGFIKIYCQVHGISLKELNLVSYVEDITNATINQYSTKIKKICTNLNFEI
jgi:hypothetical protein